MAITLTENAAKQIQSQLAKRGKGLALRIGVKKVGCTGLAHTFDIADEIRPGDHTFESHNARVVLDTDSLSVLDGSRIDFVKEGLKQMFKFDNPNVESECGCGESFNVKKPKFDVKNTEVVTP
ncbi:iron-sulfur cluster assembly accessory protein [Methylibium sp.]|uniref:HesB/IscA family protein n=1 Tax=Methylibium sp. TaxID=2067992 RepID=UPI0017ED734F|nr:iron-sulfur cluster assembly accessory protein [Methylibium sp.]MBA3592082.1 iron-sulfur cluster assembly accessory protein [Methylibium sp.]